MLRGTTHIHRKCGALSRAKPPHALTQPYEPDYLQMRLPNQLGSDTHENLLVMRLHQPRTLCKASALGFFVTVFILYSIAQFFFLVKRFKKNINFLDLKKISTF